MSVRYKTCHPGLATQGEDAAQRRYSIFRTLVDFPPIKVIDRYFGLKGRELYRCFPVDDSRHIRTPRKIGIAGAVKTANGADILRDKGIIKICIPTQRVAGFRYEG